MTDTDFRILRAEPGPDGTRLVSGRAAQCEACGSTDDLCTDHDHATDLVRGVLCGPCNRAAGQVGDDPARLRAIATYLETWPGWDGSTYTEYAWRWRWQRRQNPTVQEASRDYKRQRRADPEYLRSEREKERQRRLNPEYRARQLAQRRERYRCDPEYRARVAEHTRAYKARKRAAHTDLPADVP